MNKILVFCSTLLLCVLFTACPEPAACVFKFEFINNSQDTVICSIYAHKKHMKSDDVLYINYSSPVDPLHSTTGAIQHSGDDDSWSSFFKEKGIDTLYIYVVKEAVEGRMQICKLPKKDSNVLKILKYHAGNTALKKMVSPTITYP